MRVAITVNVNEKSYTLDVMPHDRLLDVLRNELQLLGTKEGCGKGECGTCTVLLDGKAVNACLVLAVQVNGSSVMTIEGLGGEEALSPLQENFIRYGAVQCGYCIPGMLMSAKYLLDTNQNPTREEVRVAISGNLCRCTGYTKIIDAILATAKGGLECG